jgi:ATP-binding cassette subfamily B protein
VSALLSSVGGVVALFLLDVSLGLYFLVCAPLAWLLLRGFVKQTGAMTGEYQKAQGVLSSLFLGALGGLRTIRASGTADREVARILSAVRPLAVTGTAQWAAQREAAWRMGLLVPVLQIGVLALAGYGVLQGRVTHGEMLAATGYLTLSMGLLKQLAILLRLVRARASAERVDAVLSVPPAPHGRRTLPPGPGRLELRRVRVAERGRPVLSGVDLVVPPGMHVAIVGLPGSGKSALAEVAGGLLPADAGTILLDGVPLDELLPRELMAAVTFVFERPVLFGETLREALAYTDRPPTAELLGKGLRDAGADEFTARLPDGLDTPLRDLRLSGGEFQRLGLARAVGRDARLVIFDDALTGVDTATEAQINSALDRSMADMTRIVVARRAATAARADLVAWLDGGTLRALAPHSRLLHDPAYHAVFQAADAGPAVRLPEAHSGAPG